MIQAQAYIFFPNSVILTLYSFSAVIVESSNPSDGHFPDIIVCSFLSSARPERLLSTQNIFTILNKNVYQD